MKTYDFSAADSLRMRGLGVVDPDSDLRQALARDVARLSEEKRLLAKQSLHNLSNWNEATAHCEHLVRERDELRHERDSLKFYARLFAVLFACSMVGQAIGYLGWIWR